MSDVSKRFRIPLDRSTTLKYRLTHPRSSGRFYSLFALNQVSFDVQAGEFVGIIGSNGCGKSTLLKILAGIYPPSGGSIALDGRVSPFLELGVNFQPRADRPGKRLCQRSNTGVDLLSSFGTASTP